MLRERGFVVAGMSINRVQADKIVAGRVVWDADRLRSQLGGKESRRLGLCDAYLRLADATYVHPDRKAFAAVLTPDYRVEDCATGEQRTAEQQWAFAARLREAHEHIHFEVLETIECGHDVAAYFVFSATARAFARFDRRQRQRYAAFRRFVLGFYTPAFRDLFFSADPPKHMFRAVVTVLAGYWRPSLVTRAWLALFFLSVRLQQRFGFAEPYVTE